MSTQPSACPTCGAPIQATSRFCPACGASVEAPSIAEHQEMLIPGNKQLRVGADTLSLPELLAVVKAGVAVWEDQLNSTSAVTRAAAVDAVKDLSRVFDSLSQQLAQGRQTVRITRRLPVQRSYSHGCPVCGHGNRASARFCQNCGALLGGKPSTKPLTLTTASLSDVGRVRQNNEDSLFVGVFPVGDAQATLCVVADGMGGEVAGEEASSLAIQVFREHLATVLASHPPTSDAAWQAALRQSIAAANQQVFARSRSEGRRGMGTTFTALIVVGNRAHLGHVGDSRAYLINPSGATADGVPWLQLSSDHSLVARLVDIGQITADEARAHPHRNVLYRAIGTDPQVDADAASYAVQPGDTLLICSDGLTNYLDDAELARMTSAAPSLAIACERLIALANYRGGRDNSTVVLGRVAQ